MDFLPDEKKDSEITNEKKRRDALHNIDNENDTNTNTTNEKKKKFIACCRQ